MAVFLFKSPVNAHPGNTDSFGCHTCRTNCPKWGLYYGQYHCHTPKIQTTPICPLLSSYDYTSQSCRCYSGYIASGGKCISKMQNCWNQFGYGSTYSYLNNRCECMRGYKLSFGRCAYSMR